MDASFAQNFWGKNKHESLIHVFNVEMNLFFVAEHLLFNHCLKEFIVY